MGVSTPNHFPIPFFWKKAFRAEGLINGSLNPESLPDSILQEEGV